MRHLTLAEATDELIGARLFCTRTSALYPVVTVTGVERWNFTEAKEPPMIFIRFEVAQMLGGDALPELASHPNTRIFVDASGSPWQILEPGEEPPN